MTGMRPTASPSSACCLLPRRRQCSPFKIADRIAAAAVFTAFTMMMIASWTGPSQRCIAAAYQQIVVVSIGGSRRRWGFLSRPLLALGGGSSARRSEGAEISSGGYVQLEPEPEGGEELVPLQSLPDCRMKQMKEVEVPEEEAPRRRFEFWMTAVAEADLVASIRSQILKDASKKANFPGFRKGQVPPYALPQIMQFSVQESIIKTVESALEAYGLESLPGSDGQVTIHENVEAIARQYKTGTGIPFTATLQAAYGTQDNDDVDNVVVDVASKTVSEE